MMFHQVSRQFLKKSTIDPDRQYDSIWDYTVIFTYLVFPFLCSCLRLLFFCYFIKTKPIYNSIDFKFTKENDPKEKLMQNKQWSCLRLIILHLLFAVQVSSIKNLFFLSQPELIYKL